MIRDLARRVARRLAKLVEKDDLFEKPGERPRTPPLSPSPSPVGAGVSPALSPEPPSPEPTPGPQPSPIPPAEPSPVEIPPPPGSHPVAPVPPDPDLPPFPGAPEPTEPETEPAPSIPSGPPEPQFQEAVAEAGEPVGAAMETVGAGVPPAPRKGRKKPTAKAEPASAAPAAEPAPAPPAPASAAPKIAPKRPTEGCVPVDADGLRAALVPNGRPLVVNHWATWCDPCVDELPRLVRAAAGVADLGEFVGVSWDLFDHPGKPANVAKKVAQFADSAGVGYASVLFTGTPQELFAICGLDFELIPQTVVIAPDGRVVWHKKGVVDHDDVFPLIHAVKGAR